MSKQQNWLSHTFEVVDRNENWNDVGGIYIFARLDSTGSNWYPTYIGKTESLKDRLPTHEMIEPSAKLGATHIHAMVVESALARTAIEAELISHFKPPLNTQLK